jgi:GAF domain-containing protein
MGSTAQVRLLRTKWCHGELSFVQFLDSSVRALALQLNCHRAAVWVFEDTATGRRLRCLAMYDTEQARAVRAPAETGPAVADYFRMLKVSGVVHAPDARAHPATEGLLARQNIDGVRSLLGGPLSMNGETYGTVVCTNLRTPCHWRASQLSEMRQTCSLLSLVIADALRDATLTQPAPLTTISPAESFRARPDTEWSALAS